MTGVDGENGMVMVGMTGVDDENGMVMVGRTGGDGENGMVMVGMTGGDGWASMMETECRWSGARSNSNDGNGMPLRGVLVKVGAGKTGGTR